MRCRVGWSSVCRLAESPTLAQWRGRPRPRSPGHPVLGVSSALRLVFRRREHPRRQIEPTEEISIRLSLAYSRISRAPKSSETWWCATKSGKHADN